MNGLGNGKSRPAPAKGSQTGGDRAATLTCADFPKMRVNGGYVMPAAMVARVIAVLDRNASRQERLGVGTNGLHDSALEEDGFEPLVPPRAEFAQQRHGRG